MVLYNFKKITIVPPANDFVDIVLSKTQRKTPTVVHPGYQISRIRQFYMRKVKFASSTLHERLTQILDEFPVLDDIHPFYADLMNVLYDKDHYKLALGQLHTARNLVDAVAKDYCKMLKYGDTLFRCKQLKRAALGRMVTVVKKQASSLAYLEQVRQHLARLPSIDPNTRTILICGYPNVGKSSFLNKVTRADVDVQPYAFTTQSLFVGHTDYKYLRWQVIDTPGVLDRPLEERNTKEMQSITALAHLRAVVLYMMDMSGQCGYSIKQQVALFHNLKPLFSSKPLVVVANKIDQRKPEDLDESEKQAIQTMVSPEVEFLQMSTLLDEGVAAVKEKACEKLLAFRVDQKLKSVKAPGVLSKLRVATPQPRDTRERPPSIPASVIEERGRRKTKREEEGDEDEDEEEDVEDVDAMEETEEVPFWERGFNSLEWKKKYQLQDPEWRFDKIPEIMDGHNIADYIDPEIFKRVEELEKEEEERDAQWLAEQAAIEAETPHLTEEQKSLVGQIREKRQLIIQEHRENKGHNHSFLPRNKVSDGTVDQFESHLLDLGIDPSQATQRLRSRSRSSKRVLGKRLRSRSAEGSVDAMETESPLKNQRTRSRSASRGEGLHTEQAKAKAQKIARKAQRPYNKDARKGEADRAVLVSKPKHLFSGKRKSGSTDRR